MEKTILKKINQLEYHYTLLEEEVKMNYDTRNILNLINETRSLVEKLTIPNVSQQRELLVAFMKWQQNQWLSVNSENVDNTVDTYLSN